MADLFGYTPTQSIVAPQSSRINVQAPVGNAFESLQGIMNSVVDLKKQQMQAESQAINEQMQLRSMQKDIDAKAAKAAADKAIADQKTETATTFALNKRAFNANKQAISLDPNISESDRVLALKALTENFVTANDNILAGLPNEVFSSVKDGVFSQSETALKDYNELATKYRNNEFATDQSIKIDTFVQIKSLDDMKAAYNQDLAVAGTMGIDPRTFGDTQTDLIVANFRSSIANANLEQTHDFTTIDNAIAFMDKYYNVDSRNKKKIEAYKVELIKNRKDIGSALITKIDEASAVQNKQFFDSYLDHALANKVLLPDAANLKRAQYIKDGANKTKLETEAAQKIMTDNGGAVAYGTMPESGVKNKVKVLMSDSLTQQLDAGKVDPKLAKTFKQTDSDKFATIANADLDRRLQKLKDLAIQEQNSKDPKEAEAISQERAKLFSELQNNMAYIGDSIDRKRAMMLEAYKTVVLNGNFDNLQLAYELIGDPAEVPDVSDQKLIDKVENDVPTDMQDEALKSLAILKKAKFTDGDAYEIIKNTHAYAKYGDMTFDMSQKMYETFLGNQIAASSVEYFEEALRAEDSLGSSEQQRAKREELIKVLDGENVKASMNGENIRFTNDAGALVELTMDAKKWQSFKKELDSIYDAKNPTGKGLERLSYESTGKLAVVANDLGNSIADIAQLPLAVGRVGAEYLDFKQIGEAFDDTMGNLNTMIDDWLYQDMPFSDAFAKYRTAQAAADQKLENSRKDAKDAIWTDALNRAEKGAKWLAAGTQAPENADLIKELDQLGTWLGAGLKAPEGADFGKEVSDLLDGIAEYGTSAFRALRDTIFSKAEANTMLPATQVMDGQVVFSTVNFNKNIGRVAEGRHGYEAKTQTYTPIKTADKAEKSLPDSKKSSDIGYGHKITKAEWESGTIHGVPFWNKKENKAIPISEMDAVKILDSDMNQNLLDTLSNWNAKIADAADRTFDDINPQAQAVLTSLAYNVGGNKAQQWKNIFENTGLYYPTMDSTEVGQFAKDLRREDGGSKTAGMDNRVMKELLAAGLIKDRETYEEVKKNLPLLSEYTTFASIQ